MAAIDAASIIYIKPLDSKLDIIDLREVLLPFHRPPVTDSFDPRDFREPKVPIKPWMAYFNLLRASFGAGMMGIPMAMSQSGILVGPVLCIFTGLLLIHTHLMLLWCLNEICRQLKIPIISYRYGFRAALLHGPPLLHALGKSGPCIVALFMLLSQIGICAVVVIFTSDNLRDMMDWSSSATALLVLYFPLLILEILMKNLRIISHVIMGANVMNVVALLVVFYQILRGPHREIDFTPQNWVSTLVGIGTMTFNLSAVGVILSCEKALKRPRLMTARYGIVRVGLIIPTIVSVIFGVLGYWSFGVMEENVLRVLPYDEFVTMVSLGLYIVSMCLSYPLACYPAIQLVIEVIKNHDPNVTPCASVLRVIEFVGRPIFLTMTFLIAYLVPFQGPFVAFVGNMCTTLVSLVFPALMEISLLYPGNYGRYDYILIKDILIVVYGLVCWITGVGLCGYVIYVRIQFARSPISEFHVLSMADMAGG